MANAGMVALNGQKLHYEVHGTGEPLVLIMGIGYDSSLWTLHQVAALARHFKVVIFDNRDVGRSAPAADFYTIADMADDVAGLLRALNIPHAHVLGLSMGALIAQELAVRHAGLVDRLILTGADFAPARRLCHPIAVWNWTKANDANGAIFGAEQFAWLFSTSFLRNRAAVEQTVSFLSSNPNPILPDAYARQARAYLEYDSGDRLAEIDAATLVMVGEQDLLTPPWVAREVAAAIPGARFHMIEGDGAAHALPLERPAEFNEIVIRFLTSANANLEAAGSGAAAAYP